MLKIKVKKGHNINIAGVASSEILAPQKNTTVSLSPENFRYIKPKLLVKEGDSVKLGDPIFLISSILKLSGLQLHRVKFQKLYMVKEEL